MDRDRGYPLLKLVQCCKSSHQDRGLEGSAGQYPGHDISYWLTVPSEPEGGLQATSPRVAWQFRPSSNLLGDSLRDWLLPVPSEAILFDD